MSTMKCLGDAQADDPQQCAEPRDMDDAPRDGTWIAVLTLGRIYACRWRADGRSWVDECGRPGGDCVDTAVTGHWVGSENGWLQPNEAEGWFPLVEWGFSAKPAERDSSWGEP